MEQKDTCSNYSEIINILAKGSLEQLERLSEQVKGFPDGKDSFGRNHWIISAIDCGSKSSIEWMLSKNVHLDFTDDNGQTALYAAIERKESDKYEIIELLLKAGAPINKKGFNDWTPLHQAAAFNDVEALKLLVEYGADLTIRTDIDWYATPLEEAMECGCYKAVEYLKSISQH